MTHFTSYSKSMPASEKERIFLKNYCIEELLEASQNGDVGTARMRLVYGADVNSKTPTSKKTPLILAAENGHIFVVALLVKNGADARVQDASGWTALGKAAAGGYDQVTNYLLDHADSLNVNDVVTMDGSTALMLAAKNGHFKTVQVLLSHGADLTRQNRAGLTACELAANSEIKQLLDTYKKNNNSSSQQA